VEPDCHLYLKPPFEASTPVGTPVPVVDADACTACGLCARACEFHALLALPGRPLLLPELCHGCGVCAFVCPEEAISESTRVIGAVGGGAVNGLYFRWGRLNVGEARSTPLIRAVKDVSSVPPLDVVIIDAPPGVSCPAIEAMRGADFAVLVTEPTPFGLHDLRLALQAVRELGLPHGVVVNRAGIGDDRVQQACAEQCVGILSEIPEDRRVAEAGSRGEVLAASDPAFAAGLRDLAREILSRAAVAADRPATLSAAVSGPDVQAVRL
jgi:MinD superfamily P-loop ATPase